MKLNTLKNLRDNLLPPVATGLAVLYLFAMPTLLHARDGIRECLSENPDKTTEICRQETIGI